MKGLPKMTAQVVESAKTRLPAPRRGMGVERKGLIATVLAAALLTGTTWSLAAEKAESSRPGMSMHGRDGAPMGAGGMGGMMGGSGGMEGMGGMMGMMNMMGSCNRMMEGGAMGHAMPQLPPGNEKLQLLMQAEVMQKMGETLAKYAAQIKDEKK